MPIDNKNLVQERFGPNATQYVSSRTHAKGASLQRLVELTSPQSHWHALDIATATGHTAFQFAPHVAHVVLSDLTPAMLKVAKTQAEQNGITNVSFKEADAENLPFDDHAFDLVTCRIAPHHFPDIEKFCKEAARVLKTDGVFAVVDNIVPDNLEAADYLNAFEKHRDPSHVRCLSPEAWAEAFSSAGVRLTHAETINKTMDFAVWAGNQQASEELQRELISRLKKAPAPATEFLAPIFHTNGKINFQLTEGIFIGVK
jgi:ubiquinone/menaquinone biosynthesis C-methylase UbiE